MYPTTVREVKNVESVLAADDADFPGARQVVDRLFTLPTHPYVTDADIRKMATCLRGA